MSTELEVIITKMFQELDKLDVEGLLSFFSQDVQWVDEFSRKWTRGSKESLKEFFSEIVKSISEMESKPSDFHTVITGDSALVTLLLTQTYTHDGNQVDIYAPTTIAFIREGGAWKASMIHSIPLT
jgi:ketosteroid isomerase-like protein